MKFFNRSAHSKISLKKALNGLGLVVVIAVNIFFFGSDFIAKQFNEAPAFEKAFLHFSQDHQINQSPFTLQLHFVTIKEVMSESPVLPVFPLQFFFGLLSLAVVVLFFNQRRFCFIRGEEIFATLFVPAIVIPPPEKQ